jgi:hypothetical protein
VEPSREKTRDLQLAAPQTGRDLQRGRRRELAQHLGELRLRYARDPHDALLERAGAGENVAHERASDGLRPHRLQLPRRTGQDEDDRPAVHRDDQPRRRPDGLQDRRAPRHERLLAVPGPQRLVGHVAPARAQGLDPIPDPLLQRGVELHRSAGELGDDVGGQVVGRRTEPAGRDDQVQIPEELEAGPQVVGTVAHDVHGDELDARRAQPLGEPRAVGVADDASQDLGPGDHDPGPDGAHDEQSGRCESGSRRGRRPGLSS